MFVRPVLIFTSRTRFARHLDARSASRLCRAAAMGLSGQQRFPVGLQAQGLPGTLQQQARASARSLRPESMCAFLARPRPCTRPLRALTPLPCFATPSARAGGPSRRLSTRAGAAGAAIRARGRREWLRGCCCGRGRPRKPRGRDGRSASGACTGAPRGASALIVAPSLSRGPSAAYPAHPCIQRVRESAAAGDERRE